MKKFIKFFSILSICCLMGGILGALHNTNFFKADDSALGFNYIPKKKFLFGMRIEHGSRSTGQNQESVRKNIFALYEETQSTVSMLLNSFEPVSSNVPVKQSPFGKDAIILNGRTIVDRTCPPLGRVEFCGDYEATDFTFFGKYGFGVSFIPGVFALGLYVPVHYKEVSLSSCFVKDLTEPAKLGGEATDAMTLQNVVIKELPSNVKKYGDLELKEWDHKGLGDIILNLEWSKDFSFVQPVKKNNKNQKQKNPFVNCLRLFTKIGVLIPSGQSKDVDQAFSIPLGYDDTWGFPGGIGLDLLFTKKIHVGAFFDYLILLDKKKERRLKTNNNQTDFLLLNKGLAKKKHGIHWSFGGYVKAVELFDSWFFKVAYQYMRRQNDRLQAKDEKNCFDNDIINTAQSLRSYDVHNLIFSLEYNFKKYRKTLGMAPSFSLFYKFPLHGKSVIDMHTFGGQISLSF